MPARTLRTPDAGRGLHAGPDRVALLLERQGALPETDRAGSGAVTGDDRVPLSVTRANTGGGETRPIRGCPFARPLRREKGTDPARAVVAVERHDRPVEGQAAGRLRSALPQGGLPFPEGEGRKLVVALDGLRFPVREDMDPDLCRVRRRRLRHRRRDVLLETKATSTSPSFSASGVAGWWWRARSRPATHAAPRRCVSPPSTRRWRRRTSWSTVLRRGGEALGSVELAPGWGSPTASSTSCRRGRTLERTHLLAVEELPPPPRADRQPRAITLAARSCRDSWRRSGERPYEGPSVRLVGLAPLPGVAPRGAPLRTGRRACRRSHPSRGPSRRRPRSRALDVAFRPRASLGTGLHVPPAEIRALARRASPQSSPRFEEDGGVSRPFTDGSSTGASAASPRRRRPRRGW